MSTGSFFVPHDIAAPIAGRRGGVLAGLTVAIKDMYDIAGSRTGGGNPEWLEQQEPATRHAGAVQRLLDAGAAIVGKAVCDEFFYSVSGVNAHYGAPVNVRAVGRLAGGSSSGSAAATAAGACDIGLGSDTGGSVRVPAAQCGIYGLRPTLGRIDLAGVMAMAPSFDVPGWFASSPGVFRNVGAALLDGARVEAPVEHVILAEDAFAQADAAVAAALRAALTRMEAALPARRALVVAPDGFDPWREAFRIIQARETWGTFGEFITRHRPKLGPGIKERMQFAATVSATDADAARRVHDAARTHMNALLPPGTIMVLPTTPCIAPLIDARVNDLESFRVRVMRLTCIAGLSGLPQVSLPVGTVAGCPIGLSFVGWRGGDEALLDLAVKVARHCGVVG